MVEVIQADQSSFPEDPRGRFGGMYQSGEHGWLKALGWCRPRGRVWATGMWRARMTGQRSTPGLEAVPKLVHFWVDSCEFPSLPLVRFSGELPLKRQLLQFGRV